MNTGDKKVKLSVLKTVVDKFETRTDDIITDISGLRKCEEQKKNHPVAKQ